MGGADNVQRVQAVNSSWGLLQPCLNSVGSAAVSALSWPSLHCGSCESLSQWHWATTSSVLGEMTFCKGAFPLCDHVNVTGATKMWHIHSAPGGCHTMLTK